MNSTQIGSRGNSYDIKTVKAVTQTVRESVPQGIGLLVSPAGDGSPRIALKDLKGGRSETYLFTTRGMRGPDPAEYDDGKTLFGATICNIADFLAALHGVEYNSSTNLYQWVRVT